MFGEWRMGFGSNGEQHQLQMVGVEGGETLRKRTRGFGECIVLCHYRSHDNNIDDMLHTTHNISCITCKHCKLCKQSSHFHCLHNLQCLHVIQEMLCVVCSISSMLLSWDL